MDPVVQGGIQTLGRGQCRGPGLADGPEGPRRQMCGGEGHVRPRVWPRRGEPLKMKMEPEARVVCVVSGRPVRGAGQEERTGALALRRSLGVTAVEEAEGVS